MLTVACVLKTGPEYTVRHVLALHAGISRYLEVPHRFVCLTDCGAVGGQVLIRAGIEPIPLKHRWPGWWSKLELFRPGLFTGPVFYADLDTIFVGPIDDLVLGHDFTVLRSFWTERPPTRIGSGLMAWSNPEGMALLYERFRSQPQRAIAEFVTTERWGDQGFITVHSPRRWEHWQEKHPGRIFSYKLHVLKAAGVVPEGASIICYHGQPRPWHTPLWREAAA